MMQWLAWMSLGRTGSKTVVYHHQSDYKSCSDPAKQMFSFFNRTKLNTSLLSRYCAHKPAASDVTPVSWQPSLDQV